MTPLEATAKTKIRTAEGRHSAPPRKAGKRHLIKPAAALDDPRTPENVTPVRKRAEQSEGERDVGGVDTDDQQEHHARTEPCLLPR